MAVAWESTGEVGGNTAKPEAMWKSGLKVVTMQFLEKAMARANVQDLTALGRLISQNEEREIQRGRLKLANERFQFNAAREVLKHLPMADKIKREEQAREESRIMEMQEAIFGDEMTPE